MVWFVFVKPVLGRQRQEDPELKATLNYLVSFETSLGYVRPSLNGSDKNTLFS